MLKLHIPYSKLLKIHVLLKEQAVDNQDGKYDGEESFEMHISQSQEELRNNHHVFITK